MELVQVRITGTVTTARYGTLQYGDLLRTDAAFAKHLVDDCAAAAYIKADTQPQSQLEVQSEAPEPAGKLARKAKT